MTVFLFAARLFLLALFAAVAIPLQMLSLRLNWRILHHVPMMFHRVLLALFGIRVIERGTPPDKNKATLVLSNHVSWLDIPVVGSLRPLSFIAKSEVATWPVVGLFAKLQRSVFLDRQRRKATAEVNGAVAQRLAKGDVIVLFPEGTTGDGTHLLPFRSSIVGAAQAAVSDPTIETLNLQPLAIAYTRRNGLPVTRRDRPFIAWYGDMELAPHLKEALTGGPLDVVVTWGPSVPIDGHRKEATAAAETAVRRAIHREG
ncbi:lysophospholipid acyltransferase family protein [Microvirga flavescens]|uniref:lysophospholipid acyltransferase family protein n=1 Tax=Microvirga flavescens TaxID=2249811 RepID=UPI001FDFAEBC|nr:lysophospholipid acyltransferase family protein [Microvirga flavescens]